MSVRRPCGTHGRDLLVDEEETAVVGTDECHPVENRLEQRFFFHLLGDEPLEEVEPYTQDELNRLLNQAAKPLYHHLIDCQQCSLEDTRYCSDGMTLGNRFDDLLLCFDDAADKRYKLMNQVIKARVYAP